MKISFDKVLRSGEILASSARMTGWEATIPRIKIRFSCVDPAFELLYDPDF